MKRTINSYYRNVKRPRYGVAALPYIAAAALGLYRRGGSRSKTMSKRRRTSGTGVTSQYDRKTVYRKKYMPKYKKRQWKKFVKKTLAAHMKFVGTRTIVRNSQIYQSWTNATQQILSPVLYGKNGSADTSVLAGNGDLAAIFANDPQLSKNTSQAKFGSAVMDITFSNLSSIVAGPANDSTAVEIDVYEFQFWKDPNINNLDNVYARADTNTDLINTGTSLNINIRGVTPFDLPDASTQGVKILKKTKYLLQSGEVATYQFRDPGNYSLSKDQVTDNTSFIIKNMTRAIMLVMKGVPTTTDTNVTKRIQVGVTRKYMYKIFEDSWDADNLL